MMTDYILSPCSLAARGLSQLMLNAAKRPVEAAGRGRVPARAGRREADRGVSP